MSRENVTMIEITEITEVMNYIEGLSAVVFDLDDTLYSEKEYVRSGYKAVAEIISQVDDAEEKLWEAFERKKPAIDTVLKDEGIYSEELKERCVEVYRRDSRGRYMSLAWMHWWMRSSSQMNWEAQSTGNLVVRHSTLCGT